MSARTAVELFVCLGLALAPPRALAAGASATLDGLRLDVRARADSVVLGEQLILSMALTNVSGRPFTLQLPLRQHAIECTYMYGAQAGSGTLSRRFGMTDESSFIWVMPRAAGTYHVAVTYRPWSSEGRPDHWFGKLQTPEFSVVVMEPSVAVDRRRS